MCEADYRWEPKERPFFHDSQSEIPPFLGSLPSFTSNDPQFVLYSKKIKEAMGKRRSTNGRLHMRNDSQDIAPLDAIEPHSIQLPIRTESNLLPSHRPSTPSFETSRLVKSERFYSRTPFSVERKDASITEPLVLTSVK